MENKYLFIIWNKALFCKDKILKDLESSFEIVHSSYIAWNKDNFVANLEAMYGRKLGNPKDKIIPCGMGNFFVIIVKDNNPKFEQRKQYDGLEIVNSNIYDKKALYRKWTAGSHRVHCSVDNNEYNHDIAVLFGQEFIQNNNLDTKGVRGFNSIDEFENCIKLFSNPKMSKEENTYYIFTKCRYDLVSYLRCKEIGKNKYTLNINNQTLTLYIFGEIDKDINTNISNDEINEIIKNIESYISSTHPINPSRISSKQSIFNRLVQEIKLLRARIKYR